MVDKEQIESGGLTSNWDGGLSRKMEKEKFYTNVYYRKRRFNRENLMDLSAINIGPLKLKGRKSRKLLNKKERERYRRENLYYKYRKFGYRAREYNSRL